MADKYHRILHAATRATLQLSPHQLQQEVAWRPETLRDTLLHILSFPELAWLSHRTGQMTTDDMQACRQRLAPVRTPQQIADYGQGVISSITAFLQSSDTAAFNRIVPAHYGGEVTVEELLNIILSHSTHHLKQVYWFMETTLGITPVNPATPADFAGIFTPETLI